MGVQWDNQMDASVESILLDSRTIRRRVRELGVQITQDYGGKTPHLVAVLKGASIFHADLVRSIELELSYDFIAVGSYGNQTLSSGEIHLLKDVDESLEGKDVLLVEDIVDTGLTLHYLVQSLRARGPTSLKIAALLNKPSRREDSMCRWIISGLTSPMNSWSVMAWITASAIATCPTSASCARVQTFEKPGLFQ